MNCPTVKVIWFDAEYEAGWIDATQFFETQAKTEPIVAETVGFLAYDSPTHVVIVQSMTDVQVQHFIKIPKGCIKEVVTLGPIDKNAL